MRVSELVDGRLVRAAPNAALPQQNSRDVRKPTTDLAGRWFSPRRVIVLWVQGAVPKLGDKTGAVGDRSAQKTRVALTVFGVMCTP